MMPHEQGMTKGNAAQMNLLFYAGETSGPGKRLRNMIQAVVPEDRMEIYRDLQSFTRRLCRPAYDLATAVLLAGSGKDLQELLSIRDLLSDKKIILLLPDREDDTISKGHKLYPRYLTYAEGDFADVVAVLRKIFGL